MECHLVASAVFQCKTRTWVAVWGIWSMTSLTQYVALIGCIGVDCYSPWQPPQGVVRPDADRQLLYSSATPFGPAPQLHYVTTYRSEQLKGTALM